MRTDFTAERLADPDVTSSETVIRNCVRCGFCTATCPTYVLLGDERDSPRGRIYLIKDMLERGGPPSAAVVKHIDRCLGCLACTTTCPADVDYRRLIDHARSWIARTYRRPAIEQMIRWAIAAVLPHPVRFRRAVAAARAGRLLGPLMTRIPGLAPLAAMVELAPRRLPPPAPILSTQGAKGDILLLQGCAEPVLRPEIRAATVRLLSRAGYGVRFAGDEGCCGALVHHLGREAAARDAARRNVDAWTPALEEGLAALVVTASGCGSTVKDYGHLLSGDPAYAARAARLSALAMDISEFLGRIALPPASARGLSIAYHAACSLQHGQKAGAAPSGLLSAAGYRVRTPHEAHLCCGSAGTYNILQPAIARQLRDRKVERLDALHPDAIATTNIGCAVQIASGTDIPVLHLVELLDWATGGPCPDIRLAAAAIGPA
ncbi:glycolate oxidase subunit GlcF [Sphingopyxis fribergensis]